MFYRLRRLLIYQAAGASPPSGFLLAHLPFERWTPLWGGLGVGSKGEGAWDKKGRQVGGIELSKLTSGVSKRGDRCKAVAGPYSRV